MSLTEITYTAENADAVNYYNILAPFVDPRGATGGAGSPYAGVVTATGITGNRTTTTNARFLIAFTELLAQDRGYGPDAQTNWINTNLITRLTNDANAKIAAAGTAPTETTLNGSGIATNGPNFWQLTTRQNIVNGIVTVVNSYPANRWRSSVLALAARDRMIAELFTMLRGRVVELFTAKLTGSLVTPSGETYSRFLVPVRINSTVSTLSTFVTQFVRLFSNTGGTVTSFIVFTHTMERILDYATPFAAIRGLFTVLASLAPADMPQQQGTLDEFRWALASPYFARLVYNVEEEKENYTSTNGITADYLEELYTKLFTDPTKGNGNTPSTISVFAHMVAGTYTEPSGGTTADYHINVRNTILSIYLSASFISRSSIYHDWMFVADVLYRYNFTAGGDISAQPGLAGTINSYKPIFYFKCLFDEIAIFGGSGTNYYDYLRVGQFMTIFRDTYSNRSNIGVIPSATAEIYTNKVLLTEFDRVLITTLESLNWPQVTPGWYAKVEYVVLSMAFPSTTTEMSGSTTINTTTSLHILQLLRTAVYANNLIDNMGNFGTDQTGSLERVIPANGNFPVRTRFDTLVQYFTNGHRFRIYGYIVFNYPLFVDMSGPRAVNFSITALDDKIAEALYTLLISTNENGRVTFEIKFPATFLAGTLLSAITSSVDVLNLSTFQNFVDMITLEESINRSFKESDLNNDVDELTRMYTNAISNLSTNQLSLGEDNVDPAQATGLFATIRNAIAQLNGLTVENPSGTVVGIDGISEQLTEIINQINALNQGNANFEALLALVETSNTSLIAIKDIQQQFEDSYAEYNVRLAEYEHYINLFKSLYNTKAIELGSYANAVASLLTANTNFQVSRATFKVRKEALFNALSAVRATFETQKLYNLRTIALDFNNNVYDTTQPITVESLEASVGQELTMTETVTGLFV